LDFPSTWKVRAREAHRNAAADRDVLGAAENRDNRSSHIDPTAAEPFAQGMDGRNAADHHPCESGPDFLNTLRLKASHGQALGQLDRGESNLDKFL
jgi:hypothetical protein